MPGFIHTAETMHWHLREQLARRAIFVRPDRMAEILCHTAVPVIHGGPQPIPTEVHPTDWIGVFVNDGRWLVQCDDCLGAQVASRLDHRFLCCDCLNGNHGGLWREVRWPDLDTVTRVEQLLNARPVATPRHWRPGQPIEELEQANHEHGIVV